ncbi:MAG: WD40 repeat domain-containing protein [Myxococcota bacterium]
MDYQNALFELARLRHQVPCSKHTLQSANIFDAAFYTDADHNTVLVLGDISGTLSFWVLQQSQPTLRATLQGRFTAPSAGQACAMVLSSDHRFAAIGYSDGFLEIVDIYTGQRSPIATDIRPPFLLEELALSDQPNPVLLCLYKSSNQSLIILHEIVCPSDSGPIRPAQKLDYRSISFFTDERVSISSSGNFFATSSSDSRSIQIHSDLSHQNNPRETRGSTASQIIRSEDFQDIAFGPGDVLAAATRQKLCLFKPNSCVSQEEAGPRQPEFVTDAVVDLVGDSPQKLLWTAMGHICTVNADGVVSLRDPSRNGQPFAKLILPKQAAAYSEGKFRPVAVSPNARFVCSLSEDNRAVVCGPLGGNRLGPLDSRRTVPFIPGAL